MGMKMLPGWVIIVVGSQLPGPPSSHVSFGRAVVLSQVHKGKVRQLVVVG